MRTVTEIFDVYDFDELSQTAQKKVVSDFRDINVDYIDWDEFVLDDATQFLESLGWNNIKIHYTGFWSQGDGASWEGTLHSTDVPEFIKKMHWTKEFKPLIYAINKGQVESYHKIETSGYHSHEYTMNCYNSEFDNRDLPDGKRLENLGNLHDKLVDKILDWARDYARTIYKNLEDDYNDQTSDEAVKETIQCNDYWFTAEGKIYG